MYNIKSLLSEIIKTASQEALNYMPSISTGSMQRLRDGWAWEVFSFLPIFYA